MQSPDPSARPVDSALDLVHAHASSEPQRAPVASPSSTASVVAVASTSAHAAPPPSRVPAPLDLSAISHATRIDSAGTAENPLIPKRRRRTTPAELAILEDEFRLNQRPDQGERAKIAQRLGMTSRAIQVWYQNRRQKEKKESSSNAGSGQSSSVASGDLSSPRDLDGVSLSFSSSPLPSPQYALYPAIAPSRPPFSSSTIASTASTAKGIPSPSTLSFPGPSSADKENVPISPASAQFPSAPQPYVYSYPSTQAPPRPSAAPAAQPPRWQAPVFLHRPSNSSIIAAKKHVRKRPLGSHAPLARTPSLPHAFDFPPSPPKNKKPPTAMARSASVGCAPSSTTAARITLADVAARRPSLGRRASSLNGASSLFDLADGPETNERSAPSLDSLGRRRSAEDRSGLREHREAASATETEATRQAVAEDLLQHMQSDPPSASSPAPLTRTRVFAHNHPLLSTTLESAVADESDEEADVTGSFVPSSFGSRRPPLQNSAPCARNGDPTKARVALLRSHSYGDSPSSASLLGNGASGSNSPFANPSSSSSSSSSHHNAATLTMSARVASRNHAASPTLAQAAESARAGTEDACALNALERKRARILNDPTPSYPVASLSSAPLATNPPTRSRQARQAREPVSAQRPAKRARSAAVVAPRRSIDSEPELEDLSFSSTSTASTVDSIVTVDSPTSATVGAEGYFALRPTSATETDKSNVVNDERECAELLLGLGGGFF
ncbi:hypothetical protein JCM10212_006901 [Sporobolomyces blumeae]